MTMMIMMIIITFCALDILILEFLPCKWQLVWNMLIKMDNNNNNNNNCAFDILILEFLPCKWQLVWNMLIKIIIII